MAQKNIKVSEVVHETLEKKKSEDQTFDDVLRELLDLTPDLDDLVAYFRPGHAEAAKEVVTVIDEQGEFEWVTRETDRDQQLDFVSIDSGLTIARARFTETTMRVQYRNQHGDLDKIGTVKARDDGQVYCHTYTSHDGIEEIVSRIESKVAGAYRKWG